MYIDNLQYIQYKSTVYNMLSCTIVPLALLNSWQFTWILYIRFRCIEERMYIQEGEDKGKGEVGMVGSEVLEGDQDRSPVLRLSRVN